MELHNIDIYGSDNIYAVPMLEKEFSNAVNEAWKNKPPWKRYQKKLIEDLSVLSVELEGAIRLPQYEKLTGEKYLYSIRHPKTKKNVRVLYTIVDGDIILLHAFLEKNDSDYRRGINLSIKRLDELEE